MIIIPDIHGRNFWKDAIKGKEDEEIIFLGDYTDPYPYENISKEECLNNFKEILDFKKSHMDNVILLLGNHDFGYINPHLISCRHDYSNHTEYYHLFTKNKDLFQMAYAKIINGKKYLFSHAGFTEGWWKFDLQSPVLEPEIFVNNLYITNLDSLCQYLKCIDYYRGGIESYGSCIWADIRSFDTWIESKLFTNTYQIVGHTQLNDNPIIDNWMACLDCRRGFILDDKGDIKEIKDED